MRWLANEPISYDDHGDIPFFVPFSELKPRDISLYLQLDTRVGRSTCRQRCDHCFYINQPAARGKSMDLTEGRMLADDLGRLGYRVFPMISDSFAENGRFLQLFGNTHMRDFREADGRMTKTMARGQMWTSGAPLLRDDYEDLLLIGVRNGFGSVTITFHGVLECDFSLRPHREYPIKGTFPGRDCVEIVERIHTFNRRLTQRVAGLEDPVQINVGVTIGKHNHQFHHVARYASYFNSLGVDVLRFNCYHDHGWQHPDLVLTQEEIAAFYRDLKRLHDTVPLSLQLGVDEDFGTSGIEVMGFPAHTGWCRAGRQLFAIVPEIPAPRSSDSVFPQRVGTVAACVDAFEPIVGVVVRDRQPNGDAVDHAIEFDVPQIDALNAKRTGGTYLNGCFAHDMLAQQRPSNQQPHPSAES
jgi:hypothetical protein